VKQIGTPSFTCKHVQAVNNRYGEHKRGSQPGNAWPLDVGYMTITEIQAKNPELRRTTIASRLDAGERQLQKLIAPPRARGSKVTPAMKSGYARVDERAKRARIIRADKRAFFAQQKAGHKAL
jgi:hypothetical protein